MKEVRKSVVLGICILFLRRWFSRQWGKIDVLYVEEG